MFGFLLTKLDVLNGMQPFLGGPNKQRNRGVCVTHWIDVDVSLMCDRTRLGGNPRGCDGSRIILLRPLIHNTALVVGDL